MEYLVTALTEVGSAAQLSLKSPASIDLLEQACELLELANSAVNDRSISTQTYKLKSKVNAFINVMNIGGDDRDVQTCFQEILNHCALLEDMCNSDSSNVSDMESSSVIDVLSSQPSRKLEQQISPKVDMDLGPDALHCLQRQILGIDNDYDREVNQCFCVMHAKLNLYFRILFRSFLMIVMVLFILAFGKGGHLQVYEQ